MWKHENRFMTKPPATVVQNSYIRNFATLSRTERDELGYNEAVPIKREQHTTYETRWTKGDDLIYREEIVNATVDENARTEAMATEARAKRDRRLTESDWTQLADCPLTSELKMKWVAYRQALRDIPQQPGFPTAITWPEPVTDMPDAPQ